jgi:hypothetical protein
MPTACRRKIVSTGVHPRHPHQVAGLPNAQGPTSRHGESQRVFDGLHGARGRGQRVVWRPLYLKWLPSWRSAQVGAAMRQRVCQYASLRRKLLYNQTEPLQRSERGKSANFGSETPLHFLVARSPSVHRFSDFE